MEQIVFKTKKGNVATDSLKVAKGFGKRHDAVLRAISNLDCDDEFRRHNYAAANYTDAQGKKRRSVVMTKDGFTFLAMGFTGKRAAEFKQGYIEQFNQMESELRQLNSNGPSISLAEHTTREVQVANSKSINNHQYLLGGMVTVIAYNRENCRLHTGKRPSEIVKEAKAEGLPAKYCSSAKEVLRRIAPQKACAMSLADQLVRSGASLAEAAEVSRQAEPVFAGLMRLGFRPTHLSG